MERIDVGEYVFLPPECKAPDEEVQPQLVEEKPRLKLYELGSALPAPGVVE